MSIPRPSDWERWCEEVVAGVTYLAKVGPEMIRLAKMPTTAADGYPSTTGGERVAGESELTPTERAADDRAFGDGEPDRVLANLGALFGSMRDVRAATARAQGAAMVIERRGDQRYGRQVEGDYCAACDRFVSGSANDKLKGGYCTRNPGCWSAWRRFREAEVEAGRDPSPIVFRSRRRAELRESA